MKVFLKFLVMVVLSGVSSSALALSDLDDGYLGPAQWTTFDEYMKERNEDDRVRGLSYIFSGAIATIGGVVGYSSSTDSLSRGLYVITQSVGVAVIGYGANTYWLGNEYSSFYHALDGSSLSPAQKAEVLQRFLERDRAQRRRANWIKIATHSLIAVANLYSASHEEDKTVRGVLHFLAGTNAVIAFSYAF